MPLSVAVPVIPPVAETVSVAVSAVLVEGVKATMIEQVPLIASDCPFVQVPPSRVKSRALAPVMEKKGEESVVEAVPVLVRVMVVIEELP